MFQKSVSTFEPQIECLNALYRDLIVVTEIGLAYTISFAFSTFSFM